MAPETRGLELAESMIGALRAEAEFGGPFGATDLLVGVMVFVSRLRAEDTNFRVLLDASLLTVLAEPEQV